LLAEFAVVAAGHRRAGKWNSENGPPVRVLQAALSLPFPRNAGAAAGPFDASCCTASISGLLLADPAASSSASALAVRARADVCSIVWATMLDGAPPAMWSTLWNGGCDGVG
jgi:hypothetical protein